MKIRAELIRRRRLRKRILKILTHSFHGLGIFCALFVLAFSFAAWRLSQGPVSLKFMTGAFQSSLSAGGDTQASLDDVVLSWEGWKRPLSLHMRNLYLKNSDGDPLAVLPDVSVTLSVPDLMVAHLRPIRARFLNPKLILVRHKTGGMSVAVGDKTDDATDVSSSGLFKQGAFFSKLREIVITNADVIVDDQTLENTWKLSGVNTSIIHNRRRDETKLDATIPLGYAGVELHGLQKGSQIQLEAILSNLQLTPFLPLIPDLSESTKNIISAIDAPFTGSMKLMLSDDGTAMKLQTAAFDVYGGPGVLRLKPWQQPDHVLSRFEAAGQFMTAGPEFQLTNLMFDFDKTKLKLSGGMKAGQMNIEALLYGIKLADLPQYWPDGVAQNPRDWILENLQDGRIDQLKASFHGGLDLSGTIPEFTQPQVKGELSFSGITVNYIKPMPPVQNVNGAASFDENRMDINLKSGTLGRLIIDSGVVALSEFNSDKPIGDIELSIKGPAQDTLQLVNHKPLSYMDKMGFDPTGTGGDLDLHLHLNLPLLKSLLMEDIKIQALADIHNLSKQDVVKNYDLAAGNFALKITKKGLMMQGDGQINQVPLAIDWREAFVDDVVKRRTLHLQGQVAAEKFAQFNVDVRPYIGGVVGTDVLISTLKDGSNTADILLNLKDATLDLFGYKKAKGVEGAFQTSIGFNQDAVLYAKPVVLTAPDLSIKTDVRRGPSGYYFLELGNTKIGQTEVKGRLTYYPSGQIDAELDGPVFDASFLLDKKKDKDDKDDDEDTMPIRLKGHFDRLILAKGGKGLDRVNADLFYDGKRMQNMNFKAAMKDGKRVEATITPAQSRGPSARKLWVYSDDAGQLLWNADVYDNMKKGNLTISGSFDDRLAKSPLTGKLIISGYRLVKAPTLMKLLSVASLTGVGDTLKAEGISFKDLIADFVKKGKEIRIIEAKSYSSAVGITTEGTINTKTDQLNLTGLLIPAYTINKILGNIPILGTVLTGLKGEGLFAVSYSAKGNTDDPDVSVNPLETLAPGVLRDFVGAFEKKP